MKFRLIIFLFLLISISGYGQRDLIITQAGEEIRCKIIDESSMKFGFAFINNKGKILKSEIFKTLISSYEYDYYPEDILPNEKIFKTQIATINKKKTKEDLQENINYDKGAEVSSSNTKQTNPTATESKKQESVLGQTIQPEIKTDTIKPDSQKVTSSTVVNNIKESDTSKISVEDIDKKASKEILLSKPPIIIDSDSAEVIKSISLNSPKEDIVNHNAIHPKTKREKSEFRNYLKYRVGIKAGLANMIEENFDKSPAGLFKEKLLRGWVHGVDAAVFVNDYLGVGVSYSNYLSSSSAINTPFSIFNGAEPGVFDNIKTDVSHKFMGASFLFRYPLDYKTFITATASPSYILYTEKGDLKKSGFESSYKNTGYNWGGLGTLGIDFLIGDDHFGRDIILSFECGYAMGEIDKLNYNDGNKPVLLNNPINLNRLEFSVALRFTRFPGYLR